MADGYISQVKLPGGGIYEIKDKWAREQIAGGVSFVVCSSASDTPIGVTWANEQGQIVQGTLKASEAQRGTFYLVPAYGDGYTVDSSDSTGDQSHFDEYVSAQVGSTYMWERLGRKDIDLTNYLRVDDAATTYLKKSTDTATGVHTYSYNGEALKVTGTSGQVTVSGSSGKIAVTGTSGSIAVSGSSGSVVVGADNAKTTVNKSSVKVQADATQNVTVGTTKVTITGCNSVTSEWNKSELKFTPATAGQTMEVKSDGTIVKKTGTNGATTNTYSFKGDFSSNNDAVVRKSDLADWDGSNKYVKKAGDTMTGALTNSYAGDAINVTGSNGAVVVGTGSAKTTVNSSSMKVQADGTQNVTVGTGSVVVTGCSGVTATLDKNALAFTVDDCGSASLTVCGSGTAQFGLCGTYTFANIAAGDTFDSLAGTDIIRKSDLTNYVGSQGPYLAKNSDDSSTGKYTFSASDANTIKLTGASGGIAVTGASGQILVGATSGCAAKTTATTLTMSCGTDSDKAELKKDSLQIYLDDANKYTKVEGDKVTVQNSTTAKTEVDKTSVKITNGNASATTVLTSTYSSNVTTAKIEATGTSTSVKTTYAFPSTAGGDSAFAGSGAANTTVMRKGDLKALAFKASVSGTATGSIDVYKWKLGTETTKNVTFTKQADSATSFQFQPEGTVSKPSISVATAGSTKTFKGIVSTFSGSSVVASMNAGSWTAGSWTAGSWSAGSYTAGSAFSQGTLPTLTMTMDTMNTEQLNISFSQGSLPSYTPPTCTLPTCTLPTCTLPTCTLPTVKTTATLESITAKTSDASYQLAATPAFTGKKYNVTSVYPGALAHDGTEAISGVSLSVSAS